MNCSSNPHVQRLENRVVTRSVQAEKRRRAMFCNLFAYLWNALSCAFRAADFYQHYFIVIGFLVLCRDEAAQTFIAGFGASRRIGSQVADQDSGKKGFIACQNIKNGELRLAGLVMHFAGDFHG